MKWIVVASLIRLRNQDKFAITAALRPRGRKLEVFNNRLFRHRKEWAMIVRDGKLKGQIDRS
ncbi:MAG TPA: hypothetical protein VEB86_11810 [Chryseosolibacter sp.]|nr:hypothetical protein [Chryseosolibacter sp.]